MASTLIAAFGFGGYSAPPNAVASCKLCTQSNGAMVRGPGLSLHANQQFSYCFCLAKLGQPTPRPSCWHVPAGFSHLFAGTQACTRALRACPQPRFFASGAVPVAGTEGMYTASVIGAAEWVIVAWIW